MAKCFSACAAGQGQPLSTRNSFKNVLGTRLEGTFGCKARLENAELKTPLMAEESFPLIFVRLKYENFVSASFWAGGPTSAG